MVSDKLRQYTKFFKLQRLEQEKKYEQYAMTSLSSLFSEGRAFYGNVSGVTEQGHIVLNFTSPFTPRLKVPMVMCILKSQGIQEYGSDISGWSCNSLKFRENIATHTSFSDVCPLYFLTNNKTIGCGQVCFELIEAVKGAIQQGRVLYFVMLESLPPTELLKNLTDYITRHPDDPYLLLEHVRTYDQWQPKVLDNNADAGSEIIETLKTEDVCILQGPPGTGKSFTLGAIISKYTEQGRTVCVTTQSNASLISLISQDTLKPHIERGGPICKTVLTSEELNRHPFLINAEKGLRVQEGGLLCTTYYSLSRIINETDSPIYDLIIIEEASQAFLTAISAFMKLGQKCIIVGDPMQLPPVVEIMNETDYQGIDIDTQSNGMMTIVRSLNVPSFRITSSYRLTPKAASQTKVFYGGNLNSMKPEFTIYDAPNNLSKFFPDEGGTIIFNTNGSANANCSEDALNLIEEIVDMFVERYPKQRLAILSPFVSATKKLQERFYVQSKKLDILIETINRIQGETVDYCIYYIPQRNFDFAFSDNLFNVATSRSKSTTLIITDIPIDLINIRSNKVYEFISKCERIN